MNKIPERLITGGRQPDPIFDFDEALYVRCQTKDINAGHILPSGIRFPDWSTNRSKYSEPGDVLLPSFARWGIGSFKVRDIPSELQFEQSKCYSFCPVHDPLPENYAHTEVRTFKDGQFDRNTQVATSIKKLFRILLSEASIILKYPIP